MLGGIKKVRQQTAELEKTMNNDSITSDPAYINANRSVIYRAFNVGGEFFNTPRKVSEIEAKFKDEGARIIVERVRHDGALQDSPTGEVIVSAGDAIVITGRREAMLSDSAWLGQEVADAELLTFAVEKVPVMVAKKDLDNVTVQELRDTPAMAGVVISDIKTSNGNPIPVLAQTQLHRGYT